MSSDEIVKAPKLFISYSWSSPTHEQWVLDFATELIGNGIDVILDKWALKEGHDAVAFMEKMVTDEEIKKVAIICDEIYAAKADGRAGGVGTETQIISKKIYEKQEQNKFVAVVTQKNESGEPFLPTYCKPRIYIDLSEPDKYKEEFEKLLRWVFDEPLYKKPELGKKPSFLNEGESISLGTTTIFRRVLDAIRNNKTYAPGSLEEYLTTYAENLERFRLVEPEGEFDESVIENIERFIPYRNEFIQLLIAISQYASTDESVQKIHRFFESLFPYMDSPEHVRYSRECDYDNFKFIIHELFLYAVAILIKYERFNEANILMEQKYYVQKRFDSSNYEMEKYTVFWKRTESLENRNKRLNLNKASLRADLLKDRCSGAGVEFRYLTQADFVLYLRSAVEAESDYDTWWPETLLYIGHSRGPFEIFARAVSKKYFDRVKCLLGIDSPEELEELMAAYKDGKRRSPSWQFEFINPPALIGYDELAKRP